MLTIVLLPGMDGTGTLFKPFTEALGQEFNVKVVSYPTDGALEYAELEQHARRHLPDSERYVILGESFSGPIAVSIAATKPRGMLGLILCSTFVRNPQPVFGFLRSFASVLPVRVAPLAVLSAVLLGRFSTPRLRADLAAAMSTVTATALRSRLRAVLSVDVSAKLKAVEVPSLYLLAAHDQVVPSRCLRHIQAVLPTVQVASINAPHFLLQAAPGEAARAVSAFVRPLQNSL